jgi:hypothetical protein
MAFQWVAGCGRAAAWLAALGVTTPRVGAGLVGRMKVRWVVSSELGRAGWVPMVGVDLLEPGEDGGAVELVGQEGEEGDA